ncbi:LacI family DNA-binding transcriptional regulator [Microbacterium sp. KSW4-11]|uniref:LacI family DNA-binding transcriptional regulator n=1 Tax=Microbacterium gawkjiense TaxID=3067309 RepID=A0ABU3GEA3_9MICO|nr:LacI family DNA-binding transcriptional regulator [Microbacterium sp. KSW4-11]MDT3318139.1 LacI family DNA-binding transcriptional regulator [Microbacterium sp. KSW4-11]
MTKSSRSGLQQKRVTLRDVADRAGVSETTASHVMTGRRYVAEATQQRVLSVMEELKYRPNQVARSLRARSTSTVAFIVKDIANVSATTSIREAAALLRRRGFATTMVDSPDEGFSSGLLQQVVDRLPSGVIFFGQDPEPAAARLLRQASVPFVVGGLGAAHTGDWDIVYTDQAAAIRRITAVGLAHSQSRVCFIGGNWDDEGARTRLKGFTQAIEASRGALNSRDVQLVPYTVEGGRSAMANLLSDPPTLVVCGSDQIAIGAILKAQEAGLRIPQDIEVSGFDNVEASEIIRPSLTTIDARLAEQGMICAEMLLQRIELPESAAQRRELEPRVMERQSMRLSP